MLLLTRMQERRPSLLFIILVACLAIAGGLWLGRSPNVLDGEPVVPVVPGGTVDSPTSLAPPPDQARPRSTAASAGPPEEAGSTEGQKRLEWLRAKLENPNVAPGEALLSFGNRSAMDRFNREAVGMGLEIVGTLPQFNTVRIRYGSLERLRDAMAVAGGEVANVEGNPLLSIPKPQPSSDEANQGGSRDFGRSMLSSLNASGDRRHWGDHVTVAVLDTGVRDHPTFDRSQVSHLDLVQDGLPFDNHGTSVASLIGGQNPQAPGLAPGAQILDIRVADAEGNALGSVLAQGIIMATDCGAQVINISLGGYGDSALLADAVQYAFQRGAVVVAAAGNEAYTQLAIPAAYETVVSVGSVDATGKQAYFSNSGQGLDLVAPGVGIITAWDTNKIANVSGTSQSSALVAGAIAAYLGWGVSPSNVVARIKTDARPTGLPSSQVGAGILQIKPK